MNAGIDNFIESAAAMCDRFEKFEGDIDLMNEKIEVSLQIRETLGLQIVGIDTNSVLDSMDFSEFELSEDESKHFEQIVQEICSDIKENQITVEEYIATTEARLDVIRQSIVRGIAEEYSPEKAEYEYYQNLAEERFEIFNTMRAIETIALSPEELSGAAERFADISKRMEQKLSLSIEYDNTKDHAANIAATLTAYGVLLSSGSEVSKEAFSQRIEFSKTEIEHLIVGAGEQVPDFTEAKSVISEIEEDFGNDANLNLAKAQIEDIQNTMSLSIDN